MDLIYIYRYRMQPHDRVGDGPYLFGIVKASPFESKASVSAKENFFAKNCLGDKLKELYITLPNEAREFPFRWEVHPSLPQYEKVIDRKGFVVETSRWNLDLDEIGEILDFLEE